MTPNDIQLFTDLMQTIRLFQKSVLANTNPYLETINILKSGLFKFQLSNLGIDLENIFALEVYQHKSDGPGEFILVETNIFEHAKTTAPRAEDDRQQARYRADRAHELNQKIRRY